MHFILIMICTNTTFAWWRHSLPLPEWFACLLLLDNYSFEKRYNTDYYKIIHGRLDIWIYLLVFKLDISLVRAYRAWTLEDKFHISARPCIIFYASSCLEIEPNLVTLKEVSKLTFNSYTSSVHESDRQCMNKFSC
jgi:hypothetical protein